MTVPLHGLVRTAMVELLYPSSLPAKENGYGTRRTNKDSATARPCEDNDDGASVSEQPACEGEWLRDEADEQGQCYCTAL